MTDSQTQETRCGFVSVVGLPNAGKSTLLNNLVGSKVSIVSRKVQTTRARILGIALRDATQIVLIDTPGIFAPKKTLEKAMVSVALSSFDGVEFILHIVDAAQSKVLEKNQMMLDALEGHKNVILVLNKIDRLSKPELLAQTQDFNTAFPYVATFMVSALDGRGVSDLAKYIAENLPEGPWMYPEDQITDMPMRMMAAEITREKIFDQLHQELPYSIFVETESWENFDNGSLKISQVVYVGKESQKGIVLGKGGARIKKIGQVAREELQEMMDTRVHLKIFVKVRENWAERSENYSLFGLEAPS
jgi:GTP-binding protein Era